MFDASRDTTHNSARTPFQGLPPVLEFLSVISYLALDTGGGANVIMSGIPSLEFGLRIIFLINCGVVARLFLSKEVRWMYSGW